MTLTRRGFLAASSAAAAAPWIMGADKPRTYRTALIGCGWWGNNILTEAMAAGQSKVVGLCDADAHAMEVTGDRVKDKNGDEPKKHRDFRELLDKEKPEIVIIATPDHWHALTAIAALKAGA